MKPVSFEGETGVLYAPANWPTDRPPCGALHVMKEDGVYYSCWKLSWQQRFNIFFRGYMIVLGVMAHAHPPVSIGTAKVIEK